MAAVFALLARKLPPRTAYNTGFAIYWAGWCGAFPAYLLGPRGCVQALRTGRAPTRGEAALAVVPVLGGVGTELLPHRRQLDPGVATMMVATATVNAVGEELLWRAVFMTLFPGQAGRGLLWPLAGFSAWHFAPQIVLPSRLGRARFVAGAAFVGAISSAIAWRTGGVRAALLPHLATDACGVSAARFRLGR